MAQRRRRLGLATEALHHARVVAEVRVQYLHGHAPPEVRLDRLVHRAHAAFAEQPAEPIPPTQDRYAASSLISKSASRKSSGLNSLRSSTDSPMPM